MWDVGRGRNQISHVSSVCEREFTGGEAGFSLSEGRYRKLEIWF